MMMLISAVSPATGSTVVPTEEAVPVHRLCFVEHVLPRPRGTPSSRLDRASPADTRSRRPVLL